jgi:nucleoside-diphosphate-sugar epimerase
MHLSANEGIEDLRFAVTGGQGFVGAALCLELLRRGARDVRSLDLRADSPWSQELIDAGVHTFQGPSLVPHHFAQLRSLRRQTIRGLASLWLWRCSSSAVRSA